MIVYPYIPLFISPRKSSFAFRIIIPKIYFISLTIFWYSTTSHNTCSSLICLNEFEILHAKVFLENVVNTFEETSVLTMYSTVFTFIFQQVNKFVSTFSGFRSAYSFKVSELPIITTCIIYRRMIIKFI